MEKRTKTLVSVTVFDMRMTDCIKAGKTVKNDLGWFFELDFLLDFNNLHFRPLFINV